MTRPLIVYTAIFGPIADRLRVPRFFGRDPRPVEWRCYTDRPLPAELVGPWRVTRLAPPADPRFAARMIKVRLQAGVSADQYSLWVDGSIQVEKNPWGIVDACLRHVDLATFKHPRRACAYDEVEALIGMNHKDNFKDHEHVLREQAARYQRAGMPRHHGLCATGVLLRRHTPAIGRLGEMWAAEIVAGSIRDQVSLPYCLWRLGVPWAPIGTTNRFGNYGRPYFRWYAHR